MAAPRRQRFAQRRKAVGFSQEELAERLGLDRSTIARWESGDTEPLPWLRPKLAHALHTSLNQLDELLSETGDAGLASNARLQHALEHPGSVDLVTVARLRKEAQHLDACYDCMSLEELNELLANPGRPNSEAVSSNNGPAAALAPVDATRIKGLNIAICGSRNGETDSSVVDAAVAALARFVMVWELQVNHGPVGVGIEVMTYIADRYSPVDVTMTRSLFGRRNVVRGVEVVVVVGGGSGTTDEVDLAVSMGVPVIPFPQSGGAAARFHENACRQTLLRPPMPSELFTALGTCTDAEEFVMLARQLIAEGVTESP